MVTKRPLVPDRVRRPPREGFSWVDRRFLREHAPRLGRDAIFLYFFFCAVSDKDGLSFWGNAAIAGRLRLDEAALEHARDELVRSELVAYEAPLVQVLALPGERAKGGGGPALLGDLLRDLGRGKA